MVILYLQAVTHEHVCPLAAVSCQALTLIRYQVNDIIHVLIISFDNTSFQSNVLIFIRTCILIDVLRMKFDIVRRYEIHANELITRYICCV